MTLSRRLFEKVLKQQEFATLDEACAAATNMLFARIITQEKENDNTKCLAKARRRRKGFFLTAYTTNEPQRLHPAASPSSEIAGILLRAFRIICNFVDGLI